MQIHLRDLVKDYGNGPVVKGINLDIADGEFFCFLGPSGCGKTTTLRMVAGLEQVTQGRIMFNDRDVTTLPAYERGVGMVFQDYAIFPHMTVYNNVAYGLVVAAIKKGGFATKAQLLPRFLLNHKIKSMGIYERVQKALDLVKLTSVENRSPAALSGGQQQRVALARALVMEPDILILDEPLSNLDAKLREEMRAELRRIQKSLGITALFVTHDQIEAMAIADRIAVMNDGIIEQVGTPAEIYGSPRTPFVAGFIGSVNVIPGEVLEAKTEYTRVRCTNGIIIESKSSKDVSSERMKAIVLVKSESFKISSSAVSSVNSFEGRVMVRTFLGQFTRYLIDVGGKELVVDSEIGDFLEGFTVYLNVKPDQVQLLADSQATKAKSA